MKKDDYILNSLSKIRHKKWELFVISRIIHLLNDPEIEFVCQQIVRTQNDHFLTDMYFPQFDLHLEVDERYHLNSEQMQRDVIRSQRIIAITKHKIRRISIKDGLESVIEQTSDFIEEIIQLKAQSRREGNFREWDFENRYSPERHLKNGRINLQNDAEFITQQGALRCFGYQGGHYQRGAWNIPESDYKIWFPRFYPNAGWHNSLSQDGKFIFEKELGQDARTFKQLIDKHDKRTRIVFARWKDPLGHLLYKFTGVFELDSELSVRKDVVTYKRVSNFINLEPLAHS